MVIKKTSVKKGRVTKLAPKKLTKVEESVYFEELGSEDLAEEGLILDKGPLETNEYFEVFEQGKPEAFQRVNLDQELKLKWELGKGVSKNLWRKIRFNIPTANPLFQILPYEELLTRMKAERNNLILQDASVIGQISKQIWDKGTVLKVPPEVAKIYTNTYYDMGYEGSGNITNVELENVRITPRKLHIASYVDIMG